ncbi:LysE family translocator [Fibrobacterota bacterium]
MLQSYPFLLSGVVLGLSAGISPGPLLALVIAETLKHDKREGMKIAAAPLVTDLPIALCSVLVLAKLSSFNAVLGGISMLGAAFLSRLAYRGIRYKGTDVTVLKAGISSLKKGVAANFLSPHPYLFWLAVGAPTVIKAYGISSFSVFLFILGFYSCLVGSKAIIAFMVDSTKNIFQSGIYVLIIRMLGLSLFVFALIFIKDGLRLFGIL